LRATYAEPISCGEQLSDQQLSILSSEFALQKQLKLELHTCATQLAAHEGSGAIIDCARPTRENAAEITRRVGNFIGSMVEVFAGSVDSRPAVWTSRGCIYIRWCSQEPEKLLCEVWDVFGDGYLTGALRKLVSNFNLIAYFILLSVLGEKFRRTMTSDSKRV
jgi:hypothetical protein